jgi:putative flippase GtrA
MRPDRRRNSPIDKAIALCQAVFERGAALGWPRDRLEKLVRFAVSGCLSSGFFAVVVLVLSRYTHYDSRAISVVGYLAALPLNFILHREYTFLSEGRIAYQVVRFAMLHASNILVTVAIMHILVVAAGLPVLVGILGVVAVIPLIQFFIMEQWIFKGSSAGAR